MLKIERPEELLGMVGLTSRVLIMWRSEGGQTVSRKRFEIERGAGSEGSHGPPTEGPERSALAGVEGMPGRLGWFRQ